MANDTTDKLLSLIEKQIRKVADNTLCDMAQKLGFDIEEAYEQTIEEFYSHYSPKYYDRTGGLLRASSGYKNQELRYWGGKGEYFAGIFVDPSYIPNNQYRPKPQYPYITTTWIFNRAFDLGIHGFNKADVEIHNYAAQLSKKNPSDKYDIINEWKPKHPPRTEKVAPRKIMERKFKKLTKPTNLRKMYNETAEKYR